MGKGLSKPVSRKTLIIISLAGLALSLAFVFYTFLFHSILERPSQVYASPLKPQAAALQPEEVNSKPVVRLRIPKINVDTALEKVGLTSQGAMDVPKGPKEAAWYENGPRPGELGNSVITGHFGWENNVPAVFDNLHKLQKGDNLYVEDEKGVTSVFIVRELRRYSPNDDSSAVFMSSDKKAHLNLITCGGAWNKELKSYENRLVVFTDKL